MKQRKLIKHHLLQLSLSELLKYRLLLCCTDPNEDIELDISDLFKYPARLETSYFDQWHKDVLKALFRKIESECESHHQIDEVVHDLLSKQIFSEKDDRTLALFDDFLASLHCNNVELIHASLHRKLKQLTF